LSSNSKDVKTIIAQTKDAQTIVKIFSRGLFLCLTGLGSLLVIPTMAWSESFAVIVNVKNKSEISQNDIKFIYKGHIKTFENGVLALPLNQENDTDIRRKFLEKVVQTSKSQYKEYWIRKMFTGKGKPPRVLRGGDLETKKYVYDNPSMIGYVAVSSLDDSVRVVLRFD